MAVVCLVNRKGGVGKTTLTLGLADFLTAMHGLSILVIDVDPQANASLALIGEDEWKVLDDAKLTVADLFETAIKPLTPSKPKNPISFIRKATRIKGVPQPVHLLASSPRLQAIEEAAMETLASWSLYAGSPYLILHQALFARVINDYDFVLIDCPPSLGLITLNALSMSSGYLIPTIPDYVSTVGLTQITAKVAQHALGIRRKIPLYGTIVNRFKRAAHLHSTILEELRGRPEAQPLWDTIIPDTVRAEEALNQDAGVITLKARYGSNHALYTSFEALAAEFLQRVA